MKHASKEILFGECKWKAEEEKVARQRDILRKKIVGLKRTYSFGNVEPEGKSKVKALPANEFFLDKAVDRDSNN